MKAKPASRRECAHCVEFRRDAVLPLSLLAIHTVVQDEMQAGIASPVLIVLYNEFRLLLGDDADGWRSTVYRNYDVFT